VNNGRSVSFWKDIWIGEKPLCISYPVLFHLCSNQKCSVYDIAQRGWVVPFKIRLHGVLRDEWYQLAAILNRVGLSDEKDQPF
jgi:hypothetical protein